MPEILVYPDAITLNRAAAERIVNIADKAILARGHFTVSLSGGNTPRALYQLLASEEFQHRIDWEQVYFFWGDERCVPPDHQDSDYHMARETLLNYVPVPMDHIYRIRGENDPAQAAADYERQLRDYFLPRAVAGEPQPRFDLLLLGIGDDAHTASIFPHTAPIHETERWVVAHYVEKLSAWRITLTPPALNAAAQTLFIVTGDKKAQAVSDVLGETKRPDDWPAQVIQPVSGSVAWLVDAEAAKLIRKPSEKESLQLPEMDDPQEAQNSQTSE